MVLDASQSNAGSLSLSYQWGCANDADADAFLSTVTDSSVTIPPSKLKQTNFEYQFTLTVTDCLDRSSSLAEPVVVKKSADPVPLVNIYPDTKSSMVTESTTLQGGLEFSKCAGAQELSYEWSLVSATAGDGTEVAFDSLPSLQAITDANSAPALAPLKIPAMQGCQQVLAAGHSYQFQLKVSPKDDPSVMAFAYSRLTTTLPDLVAEIAGGGMRAGTTGARISLDGSGSKDPACGTALQYEWSCYYTDSPGDVCRDKNNLQLVLASSAGAFCDATVMGTKGAQENCKYSAGFVGGVASQKCQCGFECVGFAEGVAWGACQTAQAWPPGVATISADTLKEPQPYNLT